jgi:hypothetical protein
VFFFRGEEVDLRRLVLEEVCDDAIADACGASGDDVDLLRRARRGTLPLRSGIAVLGSNVLLDRRLAI